MNLPDSASSGGRIRISFKRKSKGTEITEGVQVDHVEHFLPENVFFCFFVSFCFFFPPSRTGLTSRCIVGFKGGGSLQVVEQSPELPKRIGV